MEDIVNPVGTSETRYYFLKIEQIYESGSVKKLLGGSYTGGHH